MSHSFIDIKSGVKVYVKNKEDEVIWHRGSGRVLHRLDGPAIEYPDGYKAWWIEGTNLSEEEFNSYIVKQSIEAWK